MKERRSSRMLYWLMVGIFLIFSLGPLLWTVILTLTPEKEVLAATPHLLPSQIDFSNYQLVLDPHSSAHETVMRGLGNSLKMALVTVILALPIAVASAYVFVRQDFRGRKFVLYFLLFTIVIPVFTTIIPLYAMFAERGWLDQSFWVAIVYVSAFLPVTTWMVQSYFRAIPKELWEAARTDGCTEWQAFTKVILPNAKPILITAFLMLVLMSWSQYQIPMILTSSQETKLMTLVMSEFMTRDSIHYGLVATAGVFAIVPPALLALVFRRHLISGLMAGAVKG
ncbi:carbohydrate ABC transporter permease [Aerococcus sp. UMB7834]|uniref:carbohydrate ABC transporter permease n=1 Tax=Aerococcus sp. UMB7834 TaxID=3046342 RepID=UPI002550DEDC|nr:carbohydrate ABC transporter permease [Aerococcus sp. UMB7834]MDK6805877.1 carbohydrate ABC transporter permease [Aerococcus sp. UMB7834]